MQRYLCSPIPFWRLCFVARRYRSFLANPCRRSEVLQELRMQRVFGLTRTKDLPTSVPTMPRAQFQPLQVGAKVGGNG
jgi:hypothetical protein